MLPLIFPAGVNWFYETQATVLADDLTAQGVPAQAIPSTGIERLNEVNATTVLILNAAECALAARRAGVGEEFVEALSKFDERVLLNYDSIFSRWFKNQLLVRDGLITAIIDIGMMPQTELMVRGIPYLWAPEAFAQSEKEQIQSWSEGRPLPWAVIGHVTADRAAFISSVQSTLGSSGLAFLPPLRPFQKNSGLDHAGLIRVLQNSDLYLWSSHHDYPYHEGFRALHAIIAGAVPAKIDPVSARHFADVPWVYPSLEALSERRQQLGIERMYSLAFEFIERHRTIGQNIADAVDKIAVRRLETQAPFHTSGILL